MTTPPPARPAVHTAAFTLIELLVAVALALIIMFAASSLLISSSRSSGDLQARNDLLQEFQIAQNYLIANVREAAYVYPQGTTLNLGGGVTTRRPGGGNWVVGSASAPILAIVKAPQEAVSGCVAGNEDACYKFKAYYPVRRGTWVAGLGDTQNNPGADPSNEDAWLLVEYTKNLVQTTPPTVSQLTALPLTPGGLNGESGKLLLDYVQPAVTGLPPLFTAPPAGPQVAGQTRVTVNLSVSRTVAGKAAVVPARPSTDPATWVQGVLVSPRNVGRLNP
ncbi:PilW family protein [Deinococcus aquaticus]|uniref:Prepilin-type N-terminal cleavage/methylation domain-containing protein n=1 Tax=Deinococcus aquaticus TaxID=328692 RepID=A0ABY7UXA1_9DEIO|nr:prepilin-type N-terminal cleavage/methylation domain-containing protein [Deinococcus aquaticus]WDA57522.1 prepilin-type N-terminal cleavage/methylation domain-containing protein [Deinococcus aquaticus]